MRIRLVSFNVQSFRARMDPVRALLADLFPDVVLLQECRSRRLVRRLAGSLGMQGRSSHRRFDRVRNAVLFRPPWKSTELEVRNFSREGRTLRRGFIASHLWQPGMRLTAVSSHLGLSERERERHVPELTDFLSGIEGPTVVGIDLNEAPTGSAARWIAGRFYDAFAHGGEGSGETFPANVPTARIDYLFVSDGIRIDRAWVPGGPVASDHRPVVADVELPEP